MAPNRNTTHYQQQTIDVINNWKNFVALEFFFPARFVREMFFSIAIQHTQMKWASKIIVSFRFRVALYTRILFKCHTQIWCSSFLFFIKWTNVNNFAKISKYTHDNSEMFPLRLMIFSFLFSGCLNNFVFINKYGLGENVKQKYTMFSLGSSELPCCLIHV